MKKIFSLFLVTLFFLSIMISPGLCSPANDIVAKMIKAHGGKQALANIKDLTLSLSMETEGMAGTMKIFIKLPNKVRQELEIMGMKITMGYNGTIAWGFNPQTQKIEKMSDSDAAQLKDVIRSFSFGQLLHPEKLGITYVDKGKETIEGKDYFLLEQIQKMVLKQKFLLVEYTQQYLQKPYLKNITLIWFV